MARQSRATAAVLFRTRKRCLGSLLLSSGKSRLAYSSYSSKSEGADENRKSSNLLFQNLLGDLLANLEIDLITFDEILGRTKGYASRLHVLAHPMRWIGILNMCDGA